MAPTGETETHMIYVNAAGVRMEFPKVARYKRNPNRLYTINDFEDGEIVTFSNFCGNDKSTGQGYAWYFGTKSKHGNFIDLDEIEEVNTNIGK